MTSNQFGNVGLCFHLERSGLNPIRPAEVHLQLWRYGGAVYGCTNLACINLEGADLPAPGNDVTLNIYASLDDFLEQTKDDGKVYCESSHSFTGLPEPNWLGSFEHPKTMTWYVFGPVNGLRPADHADRTWLCIPQAPRVSTRIRGMFAHQAAPIVLYDRFLQFSRASEEG